VYLALKTGTVDGQENPVTIIYANKLYEVQKYLSLTWHAYTVFDVVMNLAKYRALPADVQTALTESLREAFVWQRNLDRQVEGEYLQKMKAAGVMVEEQPDRAAFARIVASEVTEDYVKRFGPAMLERIRNTR
jgi:TRAP-type C4-dicarboxylate transport system substrate-binding protein